MKSKEQIEATSTLIRAAALLGATYSTKDEFEYLRLPDDRAYQITNYDDAWSFRPLWTEAPSIVINKGTHPEDVKDLLLSHAVRVRGVVLARGRRNE